MSNNNNPEQIKVLLDKLNVSYGIIRSIVHIVNIYIEDITIDTNEEYLLMIQQLITLYDAIILLEDLNKNIAGLVDGCSNNSSTIMSIGIEQEQNKFSEKEKKLYDIIQQFYALSIGIQSSVSYIILKKPCLPGSKTTSVKESNKEACPGFKKVPAPKCSIQCPGCKKDDPPKCSTTNEIIFNTLILEYRKLNRNFQYLKTCMTQKTNLTNCDNNGELQKYAIKCKEAIQNIRRETNGYNVELYEPIFELFDEPQKQAIDESKLYIDNKQLEKKIIALEPTPKKGTWAKEVIDESKIYKNNKKLEMKTIEPEPMPKMGTWAKEVIDESKIYKNNKKLEMKTIEPEPMPKKGKCVTTKKCAAEGPAIHLKNKVVSLQAETEQKKEDSISRHDSDSNVDVSVNTDPIKYRQKQNKTEIVISKEFNNNAKAIPKKPSNINTLPSTLKKTPKQNLPRKNFKDINHTIVNNIETNHLKSTSKKIEADPLELNSCELENCEDCEIIETDKPNSLEQIVVDNNNKLEESFTRSVSIIDSSEKRSPINSHKSRTSLKADKPARIKKNTRRDKSNSRSVSLRSEKNINTNPTKNIQSDKYPNISIVNQDALTPVVWALTRVKISDNGAKIFEVLDVSPIPPGRYLYNAPNQLNLLGIQPGT